MVKIREPHHKRTPSQQEIEEFAAGADAVEDKASQKVDPMDPHAKRDFKSVRIMINRYENDCLSRLSRAHGRSQMGVIRWAIVHLANELDKD